MPTKHEAISEQLIEEILDGRYRPGERLPSERDLSQRFEANRGAVREAMKRLEQLGLANIGPGGARANGLEAASLDVIGYLMARGDVPDPELIEDILSIVTSLITTAAEHALDHATDDEIEMLRGLVTPIISLPISSEQHTEARIALMQGFMTTGGNLVLRIIARSLLEQFRPRMETLWHYAKDQYDEGAYRTYARQLDQALLRRDVPAARATLQAITGLTRDSVMRTLAAASDRPVANAS